MVNASGESFTGVTVIEKPVSTLSCPSEALTVSEASPNQLRCGDMVIVSATMTKSKNGRQKVVRGARAQCIANYLYPTYPFWHHFGSFWHHFSILVRHRFLDGFWEATFSIFIPNAGFWDSLGAQLGVQVAPKIDNWRQKTAHFINPKTVPIKQRFHFSSKNAKFCKAVYPIRIAPFGLKLGQNAFQTIPNISSFNVEQTKVGDFCAAKIMFFIIFNSFLKS